MSSPQELFRTRHTTYTYFKYKVEEWKGRGTYHVVRNIDQDSVLEIILQNLHLSMGPNDKIQAKGYHSLEY